MKTKVFLNEGTMLILDMGERELHEKIIDKHDKDGNFIDVVCEKIFFQDDSEMKVNSKIKLYTKRILFFYEFENGKM